MSYEGEEKKWKCTTVRVVNMQRFGSLVRNIGEPCLYQSPMKVNKMLKPEKWRALFDSVGKVSGFSKALKLIIMGGVDPSIRPEVWEFLLGCYKLDSTAEYRSQLRIARREKYQHLIMECQKMHSSIGTAALAYVVGSKVMDMRTPSKEEKVVKQEAEYMESKGNASNSVDGFTIWDSTCADIPSEDELEGSCESTEPVSLRGSADSQEHEPSWNPPVRKSHSGSSSKVLAEACNSSYVVGNDIDFPTLPITNLFGNGEEYRKLTSSYDDSNPVLHRSEFESNDVHSFQITNNVDLTIETSDLLINSLNHIKTEHGLVNGNDSITELCHTLDVRESDSQKPSNVSELHTLKLSETSILDVAPSGVKAFEERVSEWLWTLHRIVVDVVRTDSHLEFYEDKRNLARMSDILAVYAWVDPATGYCQGMSDLLSPFVVIFEDNADAFWCFEMLLRRMRGNFQMEGPTGVMKQLETLWGVLEVTDKEMFSHLSRIGAESLHFAFRMLMVLFRRELSFTDALCMWEMMWAADFNEWEAFEMEKKCLDGLTFEYPKDPGGDAEDQIAENCIASFETEENRNAVDRFSNCGFRQASSTPLCGLTRRFWSKGDRISISNVASSSRNGDDELPIFCVAAILLINREKIIRETNSIDDMIKIFNDKLLNIHVRRSIRSAIKLRKKYCSKMRKRKSDGSRRK